MNFVLHRENPWKTEVTAPSCTIFCYLLTFFTQNLANQKLSVYLDELTMWSAVCPIGPVSHTS